MTRTRPTRRIAMLLGAAGAATLVGCGSSAQHAGSSDSFRANPSPAMHGLGQRYDDRANRLARSLDTNFRAFHDDWDKFWLVDRPSRLNIYVKPY